jgi:hypothetical protein
MAWAEASLKIAVSVVRSHTILPLASSAILSSGPVWQSRSIFSNTSAVD